MPVTREWKGVMLSLVLLAALPGLTGCGGSDGDYRSSTAEPATAAVQVGASAKSAPEFTLTALDGQSFSLSETEGHVRLIDFWATWCAPCREEVPLLNELQASYRDRGFLVLAISDADEGAELIKDFVEQYGVEYKNLIGTEEVIQAYGVLGLPAAYLLDGDGRVIKSFLGPKPRGVLVEKIEALLGADPAT